MQVALCRIANPRRTDPHVRTYHVRGGRGELAGMKERAYQHRPDFYLGSAGHGCHSVASLTKFKLLTTQVLQILSLPFCVSAYCNVYATSTCITSFASFARDVVFISPRRGDLGRITTRSLSTEKSPPTQGLAAHTWSIRAANRMQRPARQVPAQLFRIARSVANLPGPSYHCVGPS